MTESSPKDSRESFEKAIQDGSQTGYMLRLYIAGNTPKSANAIRNLRKLCEEYLPGRYQLEVIDIHQQPNLARTEQILATPTLIKSLPAPIRRVIGDMSKTERVLVGLDIENIEE